MPSTKTDSAAFPTGKKICFIPFEAASMTIGKAPLTFLIDPSSESSPMKATSSGIDAICLLATRSAIKIGKS